MPTKVAKGNQYQDWIQKWLEERGYLIHNQKSVSKLIKKGGREFWISSRNDIFGCIDLIAVNREHTLWIQATTDQGIGRKKKKIKDSGLFHSLSCDGGHILVFIKRPGSSDVYIYSPAAMIHAGKIIRRKWYSVGSSGFTFSDISGGET